MPTTPFLNMFGRSPIRPLEAHMAKVHACVKELEPFFQFAVLQQWQEAGVAQQNIVRLENEADDMKRELRAHLPKSLFTSVSRSDLLELLEVQDELANRAKDIAGIVLGRKMILPEQIVPMYLDFLTNCIKASHQANTAIHELDELLETGFSGSEIKLAEAMITKLSLIEHDTDDQQINLRQLVFAVENTLPPVNVMFLYKIIAWTGELADCARAVGDRLQILLAR